MNFLSFFFKPKKAKADLDVFPDALLVVSQVGEIVEANEKAVKLFSSSKLGTCELLDLFDGGYNLVCDLAKDGTSAIVRSKVKIDDDLFLEVKASNYDEESEELIVSIRDVSSSQKMLNKLIFEHEYLNKQTQNKNMFIAKVSSELTSPLHSINGFSQAVLEGLGGDINEKQNKYLKIINKNSAQLLELIDKIVDYSKLESGSYDYELKNFDLVALMSGIFNDYKPKAEDKKLILTADLNNLAKRNCYNDENVVKRIIQYLLDTAITATNSGSVQITVSTPDLEFLEIAGFSVSETANDKSYLMVKVSDTSTGLIENEIDSIFNPYIDVDKAIARKCLNRNLSLGLVYRLVKLLKGKIWVETESLKGSAFTFVIPSEKSV